MLICHKNRNKIHKTAISRPFFFKYRLFLYEPNDFPIPFCKKICMYSLYHSRKLVEFPKNMRETVGNFQTSTKSFKRIFVSSNYLPKQKIRWHPIGSQRTFLEKHAFALAGYSLQGPYLNPCACIL